MSKLRKMKVNKMFEDMFRRDIFLGVIVLFWAEKNVSKKISKKFSTKFSKKFLSIFSKIVTEKNKKILTLFCLKILKKHCFPQNFFFIFRKFRTLTKI